MDSNTTCVCDSVKMLSLNTAHLRGVNRFKEITRYIIKNSIYIENSIITTTSSVLEPRILIHHIATNSDSNDSGDDEISDEEEQTVKLAFNRTRRHHHHRHRALSHHASSSSSSNSSTPVHRGTSTGTTSQESSSVPQSPSSTHQTDESSSSPTRRRTSKSRWSPSSLKHALRSLSLNALFLPTEANKEKKCKKQRILRSPVAYTYVKGLSGLPTQRVPLKKIGGRAYLYPVHNYSCYPPTAELCCLQRAAALSALCLNR